MTSMLVQTGDLRLDLSILQGSMDWGRSLDGFTPRHATDALTTVQGYVKGVRTSSGEYVPGIGDGDDEKFLLLTLDIAWQFWMDDHFDRPKDEPLDIDSVERGIYGAAQTPESLGFALLRERFTRRFPEDPGLAFWLSTAADTVRSWHREELMRSRQAINSYREYLKHGAASTAVLHILATASILYGLRLHERLQDELCRRVAHNLAISCRLHNDLRSVKKDQLEGTQANAVILMAAYMPLAQAWRFVEDQLRSCEEALARDLAQLDQADALGRLARVLPVAHEVLYSGSCYQLHGYRRTDALTVPEPSPHHGHGPGDDVAGLLLGATRPPRRLERLR